MSSDPYLIVSLEGKSPSTVKTYTTTLSKCLTVTKCTDSQKLAMGRGRTFDKLKETWPVTITLRKALILIQSIIRANPNIVPETIASYWFKKLQEIGDDVKVNSNNVASKELMAKWIQYDDILELVRSQTARGDAHATLKASQELVLLSMFAYLPPKRGDLGKLRIVRGVGELTDTENGLVVPPAGECRLILNKYKTAKMFGQFQEALPSALADIVRMSLSTFPRTFLLVGPCDKPMSDGNYSTRVGDVMDKYLDRRLSINNLRHIYITQKVLRGDALVTHEERVAMAYSMMHTLKSQIDYIVVVARSTH
jgi:hypothetical protein